MSIRVTRSIEEVSDEFSRLEGKVAICSDRRNLLEKLGVAVTPIFTAGSHIVQQRGILGASEREASFEEKAIILAQEYILENLGAVTTHEKCAANAAVYGNITDDPDGYAAKLAHAAAELAGIPYYYIPATSMNLQAANLHMIAVGTYHDVWRNVPEGYYRVTAADRLMSRVAEDIEALAEVLGAHGQEIGTQKF